MTSHADAIRLRLAIGPRSGTQLAKAIGVSQPTVSRALRAMGDAVMRAGQKRGTRYFLRDHSRGFADVPVYRVDVEGKLKALGVLTPVRADGYVFTQTDGRQIHSEGLPWWMLDMCPQGFLGRAYAARYAAELGLPAALQEWTDRHAMRALLMHGHDGVGNLLIGDVAREKFLAMPPPEPISETAQAQTFEKLAIAASAGESPGSSAGGEQPKFTAYVASAGVGSHGIVKYSELPLSPNSLRWRDLLLAEHLALSTLRDAGIAAAPTKIVEGAAQRFLVIERFDRVGALGRRAVISLRALDAEFVGQAQQPWPVLTEALAMRGVITPQAAQAAQVLWAFGALIGNTDMHPGNLSFVTDQGRPYDLAPAYDMTPMSFAPTSGGRLPTDIQPIDLHPSVNAEKWRMALELATTYLGAVHACTQFTPAFGKCIEALGMHIDRARAQIARLG